MHYMIEEEPAEWIDGEITHILQIDCQGKVGVLLF